MAERKGRILVAAGANGAGKSSIAGELVTSRGGAYFNPDAYAKKLIARGVSTERANATAWQLGYEGLQRAIERHEDFTFETTLGGRSMVRELHRAIREGLDVCIWYVGLSSPELHVARVRARVARGGHDIPERKIRERYSKSLANLVGLIGEASQVHVVDNSEESRDGHPMARRVFRMRGTQIFEPELDALILDTPAWARPLVAAALKIRKP